jgi:hypothetical protein
VRRGGRGRRMRELSSRAHGGLRLGCSNGRAQHDRLRRAQNDGVRFAQKMSRLCGILGLAALAVGHWNRGGEPR